MFFKNIVKEKKLIDREIEVYRKEELAKVATLVSVSWLENRKQIAEAEHHFHSEKQRLDTEIAKLEAQKESYNSHLQEKMSNYVSEYKAVNSAKDKTIDVLEKALQAVTDKINPTIINNSTNNK